MCAAEAAHCNVRASSSSVGARGTKQQHRRLCCCPCVCYVVYLSSVAIVKQLLACCACSKVVVSGCAAFCCVGVSGYLPRGVALQCVQEKCRRTLHTAVCQRAVVPATATATLDRFVGHRWSYSSVALCVCCACSSLATDIICCCWACWHLELALVVPLLAAQAVRKHTWLVSVLLSSARPTLPGALTSKAWLLSC
jgi:hypothetical protein